MKFQLTDLLKEHMEEKNFKNIILEIKMRSCWSGSYAEVSARFIEDSPTGDFEVFNVDGVSIYLQRGIEAQKEIVTLGLEKMLFLERVTIDGMKRF